jgi:ATP-dependent RNA helicase DDX5/DBP2
MAEHSYNPFSGFGGGRPASAAHNKGSLGSSLRPVDWSQAKLVPGQWNVFDAKAVQGAAVAKHEAAKAAKQAESLMSPAEADAWRASHSITVFSKDCPAPIPQFEQLTMLPPYILKKFAAEGFTAPTPIQAQAWPILFAHRDIVGIAKTGSGKTMAFIVPAIAHIAQQEPMRPGDGPICVVLAPTRELAQQIEVETNKVLPSTIRVACIYGGTPKFPQLQMLRGAQILVSTPGRLIDFLEARRLNLMRVTYIVLDEADRMLDMGFEPQVRSICSQIRPDRQTLMFSATWPKEIQALAATFQRDFIRLHVGSTELLANTDVTQSFLLVDEHQKFDELKKLVANFNKRRSLVFCKTKRTADQLEFQLKRCGIDAMAIHGDKEQSQREFILDRFRKDPRLCLVATDVAARGLDVKNLDVVINYDFPMQIDDYVHRIGRTGRAGAKGESFTMITKKEAQLTSANVQALLSILAKAKQEIPPWMQQWGDELKFLRGRRPGANQYGRFDRRPSAGLHYQHSNRPSFDATGRGNGSFPASSSSAPAPASAPAKKEFFGIAPAAAKPFATRVTRFDDSDDEGHVAKKHRHE